MYKVKFILVVFFLTTFIISCGKNDNTEKVNDKISDSKPDSIKIDSTDIYGQAYYSYQDSLLSYHMGYSIPRDSMYKRKNIEIFENLNLLIKKNPKNPGPYLDRGNHFQNIQKYEEAIQDYNKYIELNSNNHSAYLNRGTAYERLKKYDLALADYNKVIELKPNDTIAYFNKGIVYDAINNPEQAIKEYSKVIEIDPLLAKAYYNRGVVYEKIKNYKKALEDYRKALELNPNYGENLRVRIKELEKK